MRTRMKFDQAREDRINGEIVPDAHDEDERVMGWHSYLDDVLRFPFVARCIAERSSSPLRKGDKIEAVEMASLGECEDEMRVMIRWEGRALAVPLSQLTPIKSDKKTAEAVAD
jgi:hypothetical protein